MRHGLTASRAQQLLATVRPRDVAGKARRALAADHIDDVAVFDRKLKTIADAGSSRPSRSGSRLTRVSASDHHRRTHPRRGRRHPPVPEQGPLRQLHRHRPAGGLQRRRRPPPTLARGQPTAQPRAAHHRPRAPTARPARPGLLRPESRRRERLEGSDPLPETATVRRRLPAASSTTRQQGVRKGNRGRLYNPARLTQSPWPALRTSH